ncbi:MAG: TolC family outer membrane protein [Magnetococcales bacterium]|nr:TolC family outer membrane protein [Magnetococcales bacterium]
MLPFVSTISMRRQSRYLCCNERFRNVLLLGLLYCSALDIQSAWSVTLTDAVTTALSASPEVISANKQLLITEQQVKQAFAGYLPSVDFSTSAGNEKTNSPMTRSTGRGMVSLPYRETRTTFNQMLFDGFNVPNEVKKAQAYFKAANQTYLLVIQTVSMNVIEQFLEVQNQRELLDNIKKFSEVQADFLEKVREWYQGGAGTVAEVWQTESRLALTQSSMATVESQLATATDEFVRLVGFGPDILDQVPTVSTILPHTIELAREQAMQYHPSILDAQFNLEAADAIRSTARAGFWPSIRLIMETNRTDNSGGIDGERQSASYKARMDYNLFRGGSDLARSQESLYRLEQTQAKAEQTKETVQKNVEKSWRVIHELRQRIVSLQHQETISKQVTSAYYEQFIADQRSLLDVLNAENELFTAKSNRINGYFALLVEEYRLLANIGMLNAVIPYPFDQNQTDIQKMLQDVRLILSTQIILYDAPQTGSPVLKKLPKQSPVRILQHRDGWMKIVDSEGDHGWITGVSAPSNLIQSGMFVFGPSPDIPPDNSLPEYQRGIQ